MALSTEALKENLTEQREELATEIRSLENNLLVAKEKFLKIQGAVEILEILLDSEEKTTSKAIDPDVEV
jgi:hypothetical protein